MKPWYTSKTLWANLTAGAVTVATAFGLDLGLDETAQTQLVAGVMVVVNIVLRLVTNQGLEK